MDILVDTLAKQISNEVFTKDIQDILGSMLAARKNISIRLCTLDIYV